MKVKIWLNRFILLTTNRNFKLTHVSNVENQTYTPVEDYSFSIEHIASHNYCDIEGEGIDIHKSGTQILTLSTTSTYIIIEGTFDKQYLEDLYYLIKENIIELLENDEILLFCYKLNCEDTRIDKSNYITYVKSISGVFNHSISVKTLNIDLEGFISNQFNYVYIVNLNRFYFVDSVEILTSDITRLHLKEDVLYSWNTLIRSQSYAFVSRYENADVPTLVDERLPLKDNLVSEYLNLTDTTTGSKQNCTFDFNVASNKPNIMITSLSTEVQGGHGYAHAVSGTILPDVGSTLNNLEYVRFIEKDYLYYLNKAYISDDATSSYIQSVILLPFDATTLFNLSYNNVAIYVKDKFIDSSGDYAPVLSSYTPLKSYASPLTIDGVSPYIIIKDFKYTKNDIKFYDYEPYSNYEIFIPFVGWVKITFEKFVNQRILVYYTIDLKTGISTAYIYNYTNDYIIWSGTCQVGVKLDLTTTNQIENTKQKQASDLNMILGSIGGALAITGGVLTGNPLLIGGGALSIGKTIASNVNTHNMIFDRAQTSFGSNTGAMYSSTSVYIRKTYHEVVSVSDNYTFKHVNGLPYNRYIGLSSLTGYAEISEIHFNPQENEIYQDEISEIISLLQNGVIF